MLESFVKAISLRLRHVVLNFNKTTLAAADNFTGAAGVANQIFSQFSKTLAAIDATNILYIYSSDL